MTNYSKLLACELFLFDMDGTLYIGTDVFKGARELIKNLRGYGKRYGYLTNNSCRGGGDYIKRQLSLGFPCEKEDMFTSSMATALFLNEYYKGQKVYLVGTTSLRNELIQYGVNITDEDDADIVLVGFDMELVYDKLRKAVHFLHHGATFIATNQDELCPITEDEILPDCGSICALLTSATKVEPIYVGKPNRRMVDIISKNTGIPNEKICCVGDRLDTDIAVAQNAGAVSVLLLSGETSPEQAAKAERKPDYTLGGINDLYEIFKAAFEESRNDE